MSDILSERLGAISAGRAFKSLVVTIDAAVLGLASLLSPAAVIVSLAGVAILLIGILYSCGLILLIILTSHIGEIGGVGVGIIHPVKLGVVTVLLLLLLSRWLIERRSFCWEFGSIEKYFILAICWMAICALLSPRPVDTIVESFRLIGMFAIYQIARESIATKLGAKLVFVAVCLAVSSSSLYSLINLLHGEQFRFSGFMISPNFYGIFLGVTIPLLVVAVRVYRNAYMRLFLGVGVLLGLLAVILSLTRAAWVNLFVQAAVFLILERRKRLILAILITFVVASAIVASSPHTLDQLSGLARLHAGMSNRGILWERGLKATLESPIFGYGIHYTNEDILRDVSSMDYMEAGFFSERDYPFDPHNLYIHTVLTTGIPGLLILLMLCYHIFRQQVRYLKTPLSANQRLMHIAMIAMLAGSLCNALFERQLILGMGAVNNYLWIALGFAGAIRKRNLL